MQFFEPDLLVEAEEGLAEAIGFAKLSDDTFRPQLISFDQFYTQESGRRHRFAFGLSILDALNDIHERERQFALRDERPALIFNEGPLSAIAEVIFGQFPQDEEAQVFEKAFKNVYRPKSVDLDVAHWFSRYRDQAVTPFGPTFHQLEITPQLSQDLGFFIFDHTNVSDLIDLWNMRLYEAYLYPVPLCWISELSETINKMIADQHRPIPGNPFGTKFHSEVYFGRSIPEEKVQEIFKTFLADCPRDAFHRGGVWHPRVLPESMGPRQERHEVKADEASFDAKLTDGNSIKLDTLSPDFAERYGGGRTRWVNVVNPRSFHDDKLALVYPSNLSDRTIPRLFMSFAERPIITREGWVFCQEHKGLGERLELSDGTDAVIEWLKHQGIEATQSSAGVIAKQMMSSLGGLWDTHLISNTEILNMLDRMASQEVVRGNSDETVQRQFDGRTVKADVWRGLIKRIGDKRLPRISIEDYTKRGVLKLGLGAQCPNCGKGNWHGLNNINYNNTCDRCLKVFAFPSDPKDADWKYRVTGAFSVPNYAEGAYAVALTLNVFNMKLSGSLDSGMTYTTGLEFNSARGKGELDFAFWCRLSGRIGLKPEPIFVFGEAKSFAKEAIKKKDIETLKLAINLAPNNYVVISIMKDAFSDKEKDLLMQFAKWCWGRSFKPPKAQPIFLTGIELFSDPYVRSAWSKAGGKYPKKADYGIFHDIDAFARETQKIHLGIDYYGHLENLSSARRRRNNRNIS